jgi:hypothetical protein
VNLLRKARRIFLKRAVKILLRRGLHDDEGDQGQWKVGDEGDITDLRRILMRITLAPPQRTTPIHQTTLNALKKVDLEVYISKLMAAKGEEEAKRTLKRTLVKNIPGLQEKKNLVKTTPTHPTILNIQTGLKVGVLLA